MAAQPGSEFLLRRLQRAAAIPAAERPHDVAAFVESVQLLREACDLLPLASDGMPALQLGSAEARQQVTLALLKTARAHYICADDPVSDRELGRHLEAYGCSNPNAATGDLLTTLLLQRTFLQHGRNVSFGTVGGTAAAMLDQLADPAQQQAIRGQLAQLAAAHPGQPLLSFEQLHHTCCCAIVRVVHHLKTACPTGSRHQAHASAAQHSAVLSLRRAAATVLRLEPGNPDSYTMAGAAEGTAAAEAGPAAAQNMLRSAELLLQGAQLAREKGHVCSMVHCAANAVIQAAVVAQSHRATWQAAVTGFEGAEAAVRRCKRFLPADWIDALDTGVQLAQQSIQFVQRQQQSMHSAGSARRNIAAWKGGYHSVIAGTHRHGLCDGCGQRAVGLRHCARCKTAQYCSTECQRAHWRTHKRECREA